MNEISFRMKRRNKESYPFKRRRSPSEIFHTARFLANAWKDIPELELSEKEITFGELVPINRDSVPRCRSE